VRVTVDEQTRQEALDLINTVGASRDKIIPLLQEIQRRNGYIPEDLVEVLSKETGIPVADVFGVATFYSQFRFTPSGKHMIKLCKGTACHVSGADMLLSAVKEELQIEEGETTEDGLFTLEVVACLGCCSLAPVVMIDDTAYGKLSGTKIRKILKGYRNGT
jgi:NADH-quinone oxidoreductase subunit E